MQQGFLPLAIGPAPGLSNGPVQLGQNGRLGNVRLLRQPSGVDVPLGGGHPPGQQADGLFDVIQPPGRAGHIVFFFDAGQLVLNGIACAVQQRLKPFPPVFLDVLIRVLRAGNVQHAHPDGALAEQLQAAGGGLLARLVRIVAEHHLVGVLAQQLHLLAGQRRAAGRHRRIKARLVQADHVHVALAEDIAAGGALFCNVQRKHGLAFFIHHGLGAVHILRL